MYTRISIRFIKFQIQRDREIIFENSNNYLFTTHKGAVSVSLHLISPASDGLFQNAIMLSGSSLNPSIPRVKDHLTILYNLGEFHKIFPSLHEMSKFIKKIFF